MCSQRQDLQDKMQILGSVANYYMHDGGSGTKRASVSNFPRADENNAGGDSAMLAEQISSEQRLNEASD